MSADAIAMSPVRRPLGAVDANAPIASPARIKRPSASPVKLAPQPPVAAAPSAGMPLQLTSSAMETSFADVSLCTPTVGGDAGAWTPSADLGAAAVAKAQSKLRQQSGAWTPSATMGDEVARANVRMDQASTVVHSSGPEPEGEDEDLSRALRNFRAKRSQTERSISWASRLPLAASMTNMLSDMELAFSTMRVWKVMDQQGETHLVSLRHFSQSSELQVDGSVVATVAFSLWTTVDSLELPFDVNGVAGTVKLGKDATYECIVDGEIMAEDAQFLPPSSDITHISVPRYEIRETGDGSQHVAFEVHVFTRGGPAGSDDPCDRVEASKRFSAFQTLHAQLKSVQGYVNSGRALQLALPRLPPKTYGVRSKYTSTHFTTTEFPRASLTDCWRFQGLVMSSWKSVACSWRDT